MADQGVEEFISVTKDHTYSNIVKDEIEKRSNIYGDQTKALQKILDGADRTCEVLVKDQKPVSLLIFKSTPQSDIEGFTDLKNSLEVKTFYPIQKLDFMSNLSKTLKRALEHAKTVNAENIHMTVSEREKLTLQFLISNNFIITSTWDAKYVDGVKEHCVVRNVEALKEEKQETKAESDGKNVVEKDQGESSERKRKHSPNRVDHQDEKRSRDDWRQNRGRHERQSYGKHGRHQGNQDRRRYGESSSRVESCTLMKKYVHMIKNGEKNVEGRIAIPMFAKWKEGKIVRFHYRDPKDDVHVKLVKVTKYNSFRDMLESEGVKNCIPDVNTVDEGVNLYWSIPRYRERERQYGVLGFQLKVVDRP